MRYLLAAAVCLVAAGAFAADAPTPFAGKFTDGRLTIELAPDGQGYSGSIALGAQKFPATARAGAAGLDGTFVASQRSFPFTATLEGDTLKLVSGGKTYSAKRVEPAVDNPLGDPATGAPAAAPGAPGAPGAPAASGDLTPANYTLFNHTSAGEFLGADKPDARTVRDAFSAAFHDLEKFFDARPEIGSAYEDTRTHDAGEASFKAVLKGKPVRGTVSVKVGVHGASIAVIFSRPDASREELKALATAPATQPAAAQAGAAPAGGAAAQAIPLKTYDYPDGTGSVGLADGWTTQAPSAAGPVVLKGVGLEYVLLNATVSFWTPENPGLEMQRRQAETARRLGFKPPPTPPAAFRPFISPYLEPAEAVKTVVEQMGVRNEANGGPAMKFGEIIKTMDAPKGMPEASKIVVYTWTRTLKGEAVKMRASALITTVKVNAGAWLYDFTQVAAPDDQFEKLAPTMFAMLRSAKSDPERVAQVMNQQFQQGSAMLRQQADDFRKAQQQRHDAFQQQQDQRFATHEAQIAAGDAARDHRLAQFNSNQLTRSRSAADFNEMILGSRDVLDTQTGVKTPVDYYNVDGIVEQLNKQDPGRFQQIPLRDELYPLPGAPAR